jgi:NitT/TauT family transport system ATP-binding protein
MSAGIVLDGVSKHFGHLDVVERFGLDVAAGSFVSVVGPSGCGKSTLLRMIGGLEPTSSGTVSIDGAPPALARAAKQIAVVPQHPGLVPWRTVASNARLLLDINRRATPDQHPHPTELLDEVGLGAFADRLPHELSGGMQQRVALVRAFALGAPLILMDEPFASLDEITRTEMRSLLSRLLLRHPATVVLVTHSIPEAVALSDRVLVVGPRPARLTADVSVGLGRPRTTETEDSPDFHMCCAEVRRHLREAMQR